MNFLNKFKLYLPYLLPSLLIFSRSLTDITVVLVCILFLTHCMFKKNFNWIHENWLKFVGIFIIYLIFINSFFSHNSFDTLAYSITFLRWPLFAIALSYWIFDNSQSLNKLLYAIPITFILFLSDLWIQFLLNDGGILGLSSNFSDNRLSVPFSNNVIPGRFITLFTFTLLTVYFFNICQSKQSLNMKIVFIIFFIGLTSTFITGERVSFIIFISSAAFLIFGLTLYDNNYFHILFFLLIVLIMSLFFYFFNPDIFHRTIISSLNKLSNFMNSDYAEVFITSYKKWKNNFLFGGGLHQYTSIEPIYGYNFAKEVKIFHAHNIVLNLLVETGLVGLILFYSIISSILIKILRNNSNIIIIFSSLILIYINFFPLHTHFKLSHNWINGNSWFAVGIVLAICKIHEKNNSDYKN